MLYITVFATIFVFSSFKEQNVISVEENNIITKKKKKPTKKRLTAMGLKSPLSIKILRKWLLLVVLMRYCNMQAPYLVPERLKLEGVRKSSGILLKGRLLLS